MNQKLTYIGLLMYAACYALLFGTWSAIVFGKVPNADQIVTYIVGALGALTGHILTMLNPGRAGGSVAPTVDESAPSSAQAGFARIGMLVMLAVLGAAMLGGCATGAAPRPTPQQLATQVCPAALLTMASLTALEDLPAAARADLAKASPVVGAVCAPGAAVDLSSLQALASTALPALFRIVDAAGLTPA